MPAGFRRHLVGKTLRNVRNYAVNRLFRHVNDHVDIFVKLKFYLNNMVNLHPLTPHEKLYPQNGEQRRSSHERS